MKDNKLMTLVKGMIVGGTMLVPGVSGGSMAMILGIYDRLITSVSSFFKHTKENAIFLTLFAMGGLGGMILFAKPLLQLIEKYPMPMLYFFIGAVLGGIPIIYKKAEVKTFSPKVLLYVLVGLAIVFLFAVIPADTFTGKNGQDTANFGMLVLAGVIAAIALVLPGISVSYMLLLMGLYEETMKAISTFHIPYLVPLGIGLVLGIIATTKLLEGAMQKYPELTYLLILGFILGSVIQIFPGVPSGMEIIICAITLLAGLISIHQLSSLG